MSSSVGLVASAAASDPVYDDFLRVMRARFAANVGDSPLFTTDAEALFDVYLDALPEAERQHHRCNTCRTFFNRYGGLVTITEDGQKAPAFWPVANIDEVPALYRDAVEALAASVRRAKVTGVFLSSDEVWGNPQTGAWRHLAVEPPAALVYRGRKLTAAQAAAEKAEDYRTLSRALAEYKPDHLTQAVSLLTTDNLYRSEKCLGVAEFLAGLHARRRLYGRGDAASNVVWLAVAKAPAGFCHPRSSMIGTLLDDLAQGMSFDEVKRRFDAKMHPTLYQRPQAAPAAGNIAAAEKLVERLGLAPALRRRFARLDEVEAVWRPKARETEAPPAGGVFSHLKAKGQTSPVPPVEQPPVTITWDKFARTVLPTAEQIAFYVPRKNENYVGLVTAVDPAAPPIIQWDREGRRNPVSWYVRQGGTPPSDFGLTAGGLFPVTAVSLMPSMWGDEEGRMPHQGKGVIFYLMGAKDRTQGGGGLMLFPEILKAELREVRSTVEAHSKSGKLEGFEEADAFGVALQTSGGGWGSRFRVYPRGGNPVVYTLDRWD